MEYKILSSINCPADLIKLDKQQTALLCEELRGKIIDTVSKNGGHLASNLGSVELTVAIHRAFSAPQDAVIFDVGHQSYAHKLLTGRFDRFDTIRKENGISGFMRPKESIYDPFVTGHSSNSISAAYGIYKAKCIKGEKGTAVAVIGDGALTGGMAYEALNNVGSSRNKFIVILNDNKMSISRNVGALARALTKMRNKPKYHAFKFAVTDILNKIPLVGKPIESAIFSVKEAFKALVYRNNIFTSLGFNYLGPVDGHNVDAMEQIFKVAQKYIRPTLVHVVTTKGKGYTFAENSPKTYHGVSPFDVEEGAAFSEKMSFSSVAGETLCKMAEADTSVCAVTAAMREGTGLYEFSQLYKNRFFDVGIAEQHAVTFCAGMASGGLKPYFAVYSSFLQRAYDQVLHDTAIGNYPVKFLVDRAGFVGEDGETHQGIFDVPFLCSIPGMTVYSPSDYSELKKAIMLSADFTGPVAVRYPRGSSSAEHGADPADNYTLYGKNAKKCVVTYGREFGEVHKAQEKAEFDILKLNRIYPIDEDAVKILLNYDSVSFFEESSLSGGIAEHLAQRLLSCGYSGSYRVFAVPDEFVPAATVKSQLKKYGLDSDSVIKEMSR